MSIKRYVSGIYRVMRSIATGMGITWSYFIHYKRHTSTIQYPHERDSIPPRHRGIHYLETEKCVLCWKCAEACPVDCIYIEGVRGADGPLEGGFRGQKATLTKFTVDYTVCIFCGLCEEPCPAKCIWLGPEYDYSATDRTLMEKNLLTDAPYSEVDERFVKWARLEAEKLQAAKKLKAEAAKMSAPPKAAEMSAPPKAAVEGAPPKAEAAGGA